MGEHSPKGFEQDLEVQFQRPIVDVLGVQADHFLEVRDFAAPAHLPHARDAGLAGQAGAVVELVFFPLVRGGRTCAHQGHVPLEHVEKLGKFVQTGLAYELADARFAGAVRHLLVADDPRIEIQLEHHAVLHPVLGHQAGFTRVGVQIHGADLGHLELLAVLTDPLRFVQDRPRAGDLDDRPDDGDDDHGEQAADQPAHDVQRPLGKQIGQRGVIGRGGEHRGATDLLGKLLAAVHADARDVVMHGHRHLPARIHQLLDPRRIRGAIDIHAVDPLPADVLRRILQGRHHGNALHRLCGRSVQHGAHDGVALQRRPGEPLQDRLRRIRVQHRQHGFLFPQVPASPVQQPLEQQPGDVTQDDVQSQREIQYNAGIGVAALDGEDEDDAPGEHDQRLLERLAEFLQPVPFQHVVHGAEQHRCQQIEHRQHDRQGAVDRYLVGKEGFLSDGVCQDESQLQCDLIQYDEVDMLQPALG